MIPQKKHERIAKACEEAKLVLKKEEKIRVASTKRQKDSIKAITQKYQVDFGYVYKLLEKTKRTYQV